MQEVKGEVIRACQRGSRAAFAEVVGVYGAAVHRTVYRMTRDTALAEDLAQEAFLRAFLHVRRFDPKRGPFSTWLFTIVRNLCRSHLTREMLRSRVFRVLEGQGSAAEPPRQRARLLDEEAEGLLRHSLEDLPPDYRLAFLLRAYEHLPYAEIARVLGVRTGTAKSRVHRARSRLREALKPYLTETARDETDDESPAGEVTG